MKYLFNLDDWRQSVSMDERTAHIIQQVKDGHVDIAHDRGTWLAIGMDLYCRYGDGGLDDFKAISDQYADIQKDDPERVYRSFAGKNYSASPGALIDAAKRAGLSITPHTDVAQKCVGGTQFALSTLSTPLSVDDEEETDGSADLPVFPDEVYADLPEPLASVVKRGRNPHDTMMLFTASLAALSSTMAKNVSFKYQKQYRPNLLLFIIGSPASGKGRSALAVKLVHSIHREMCDRSKRRKEDYRIAMMKWKKKDKNQTGNPPLRPKMSLLEFPVNSTLAALDSLIADNEGCGLMFTPDGGNMMTAIGSEYGNYINDLLACAENEGISRARKTDDEFVEIEEARFAVLVASTWSQICKLFGDGSDGLSSRPLYINMAKTTLWESQWSNDEDESDEEAFMRIGEEYKQLYDHLCQYTHIRFVLTAEQKQLFDMRFEQLAQTFVKIYGEDFVPSVRRMAVTALRIMCILTILRNLHDLLTMPLRVTCTEADFQRVMLMVEILLVHAGYRSDYLVRTKSQVPVREQRRMRLYHALPDRFCRAEALIIANNLGIKPSRLDKYLVRLCKDGLLKKVEHGIYEKVK